MQNKYKICARCKKELLLKFFNKDKSREDGLYCYCKRCKAEYRKEERKPKLKLYEDKKWFIENYINQTKDFKELAKIANCGYNTISRWRKKLNILFQYQYRNAKGRIFSTQHCENISKARIGKFIGDKNPNYKGGITPTVKRIRNSLKMKQWREAVFKRDGYICKKCNQYGKRLHSHHIYPLRDFPEKVFDVGNGITLCKDCHKETFWKEYNFVNEFLCIIG